MPYTIKGKSRDGGVHEETFDSLTTATKVYNETAGTRVFDPIALIDDKGNVIHSFTFTNPPQEVPKGWTKKGAASKADPEG